jgi:hypothetical protein
MSKLLACRSCGNHVSVDRIEEHVAKMHFWN